MIQPTANFENKKAERRQAYFRLLKKLNQTIFQQRNV